MINLLKTLEKSVIHSFLFATIHSLLEPDQYWIYEDDTDIRE